MKKNLELPEILPIFPLPGALLLPKSKLPLHIFEPKYLAMVDEALQNSFRLIGMLQTKQTSAVIDKENLYDIGCAGRISNFSETDDGRYMITLSGVSRFKVLKVVEGFSPYIKAEVKWRDFSEDQEKTKIDNGFDRDSFFSLLKKYFAVKGLKTDWESLKEADEEIIVNSLSMLCPFDVEEKQALLESKNLEDRRKMINTLMEFSLHTGAKGGLQ